MILKTRREIRFMRTAGLILWEAHKRAEELVSPGIATRDIDRAVEEFILSKNAVPLFKGVRGRVPFPSSSCISVNEEIVHGIPSKKKLKDGDVVSIDIGVKYNDWCADSAVTLPVGDISDEKKKMLEVTEDILRFAIKSLGKEKRWNPISKEMQKRAESEKLDIVRNLVGHGIGRSLWEPPEIPNYYDGKAADFRIVEGSVFAIEPMTTLGCADNKILKDHWTIVTKDGSSSAHFEHTVAVTKNGPVVLTCGPNGEGWAM